MPDPRLPLQLPRYLCFPLLEIILEIMLEIILEIMLEIILEIAACSTRTGKSSRHPSKGRRQPLYPVH